MGWLPGHPTFIVPRSMSVPKLMTKSRAIPKCHDNLFSLALSADKFELPYGRVKSINGVVLQSAGTSSCAIRRQTRCPFAAAHDNLIRFEKDDLLAGNAGPLRICGPRLQRLADAQIAWSKKI